MVTEVCTAQDIFSLNEKKEYTLTASCLIEHLLTNRQLLPQAVKLWQILYTKAKFDKELELKISYKYLANLLKVSLRSIHRYIKNLKDNSYLLVKHNYNYNGQVENTLILRTPKEIIHQLNQARDRERKIKVEGSQAKTTVKEENKTFTYDIKACEGDDMRGMPRNDANVTPNNTIKNKDTNNNNNVVNSSKLNSLEERITKLKDGLYLIKQKISEINNLWRNEKDNAIKKKLMQEWHALESNQALHKIWLEDAEKAYKKAKDSEDKIDILSKDKTYIQNKSGQRNISKDAFQRLEMNIKSLGYNEANSSRLINEVVFESRFGSLIKSKQDQKENCIEMTINIALKLIREGRWQTPKNLINLL